MAIGAGGCWEVRERVPARRGHARYHTPMSPRGHPPSSMPAPAAHANAPHRVHPRDRQRHVQVAVGRNTSREASHRRLGRWPMSNGSRYGAAQPRKSANACISNIRHTAPGDERPPLAETFCGKVSLVMLERVQALPQLAFPPSMEPPLVFWYDKPQWMRPVECPPPRRSRCDVQ
jgi:hypothetical protein